MKNLFIAFVIISQLGACSAQNKDHSPIANQMNQEFKDYWYQGNAEINTYDLRQVRYGEIREGDGILVFVTEDFLVDKQVKKESNSNADARSVLKLNFIRKFLTGVYDYSMMTSTFSPINQKEYCAPMKSSTSSQEWCGHSWMQLNQQGGNNYASTSYSYFEQEGDEAMNLKEAILEDGFWAQIRINPEQIPLGEQQLVPSAHYLRFAHKALKTYEASISKAAYEADDMPGDDLMALTIKYPGLNREISIIYEKAFPHAIAGWKETRSSWGKELQTIARRKRIKKLPYWGQNGNKDEYLREELMLK